MKRSILNGLSIEQLQERSEFTTLLNEGCCNTSCGGDLPGPHVPDEINP